MTIKILISTFDTLTLINPRFIQAKIKVELDKLAVIKKLDEYLKTIYIEKQSQNGQKKHKKKHFMPLRTIFYYFLLLFGLMESAIGGYLAAQSLLTLIPALTNPYVIAGSIAITLIECTLFYVFENSRFKESLGLPATITLRTKLIQTYIKQIKTLEQINKMMFDVKFMSTVYKAKYNRLAQLALLINQDIEKKQAMLGEYHETPIKKLIRTFVIGFGAVMCVASTYFGASSLITLFSPTLLGTPVGWTIIAIMMGASLGFYFARRGKGMIKLLNTEYMPYQTLKHKLKHFESKENEDFNLIELVSTPAELKTLKPAPISEAAANQPVILKKSNSNLGFFTSAPVGPTSIKQSPSLEMQELGDNHATFQNTYENTLFNTRAQSK